MTPMPLVGVLYEDSRCRTDSGFKLHELIVRCVADVRGAKEVWRVSAQVQAFPMNGKDKVMACVGNADQVARRGKHVVAVLDWDRARTLLPSTSKLAKGACKRQVACALAKSSDAVRFAFMSLNTESLIKVISRCDVIGGCTGLEFDRAMNRKDLLARDAILATAASNAAVRAHLLSAPDEAARAFRYVVQRIARRL